MKPKKTIEIYRAQKLKTNELQKLILVYIAETTENNTDYRNGIYPPNPRNLSNQ